MKFLIFGFFFLLLLVPLVLTIVISTQRANKKATGSVINYDSMMSKFVYKVFLSKDELLQRLVNSEDTDELTCEIDMASSVMTFGAYGTRPKAYFFDIQVLDGFCILRLTATESLGMSSQIPLKLNPHMVKKLNAEMLPFSSYGI